MQILSSVIISLSSLIVLESLCHSSKVCLEGSKSDDCTLSMVLGFRNNSLKMLLHGPSHTNKTLLNVNFFTMLLTVANVFFSIEQKFSPEVSPKQQLLSVADIKTKAGSTGKHSSLDRTRKLT